VENKRKNTKKDKGILQEGEEGKEKKTKLKEKRDE
jgi:hypothetical protein